MTKVSINIDNNLNITKDIEGSVKKIIIETNSDTYEFTITNKVKLSSEEMRKMLDLF